MSTDPFEVTLYDGPDGKIVAGGVLLPDIPPPGTILIVDANAWEVTSPAQLLILYSGIGRYSRRDDQPLHADLLVRPAAGIHAQSAGEGS